ncbi:MAG: hypothetical protein IJW58_01780, partial [Clostridia bacterium]|nr:hypothetical protein [Clostridia bacterium]
SGKESWVKASVVHYYGQFASGAIVAIMTATDEIYENVVSEFFVAGHYFTYCNSNPISVFYNGKFFDLSETYENGYLTTVEIGIIAEKHRFFHPLNEMN